jgi:hypothetical protein
MTDLTNLNYEAAKICFKDADAGCLDLNDTKMLQAAQVQATIGVGHAILALVQALREGLNVYK